VLGQHQHIRSKPLFTIPIPILSKLLEAAINALHGIHLISFDERVIPCHVFKEVHVMNNDIVDVVLQALVGEHCFDILLREVVLVEEEEKVLGCFVAVVVSDVQVPLFDCWFVDELDAVGDVEAQLLAQGGSGLD
jgi:hypothetical protein